MLADWPKLAPNDVATLCAEAQDVLLFGRKPEVQTE